MVAMWLSWAPFEWRPNGEAWLELQPSLDAETASHLLLLAPIAAVLGTLAYDSVRRRPFVLAWTLAASLGVLLELGQWWIAGRSISPFDLIAHSIGTAVAIWTAATLRRHGIARHSLLVSVAVLVSAALFADMVYGVILPNTQLKLTQWDPRFGVLAADEFGGSRRYEGRVWDAKICAGEPAEQVCISPGADAGSRQRLTQVAEQSQHIEVSAQVSSDTDRQVGPARIMTFSQYWGLRNVTLAQEGRHLVLRVRTPLTGSNGTRPEFILADAVHMGIPTKVMATFSRGVVFMKAESEADTSSGTFRPDLLRVSLRLRNPAFPVVWHKGRAELVSAIVYLVTLGYILARLMGTKGAALLAIPAVATASVWAVDLWVLNTLPPGIPEQLLVMIGAGMGVVFAVLDGQRLWCTFHRPGGRSAC